MLGSDRARRKLDVAGNHPLQKRMESGVRNYVHSWRPPYGFGVCLSLRLRNKCLRHVDRDPVACDLHRTTPCFLRRHNTFRLRLRVFIRVSYRACRMAHTVSQSNVAFVDCLPSRSPVLTNNARRAHYSTFAFRVISVCCAKRFFKIILDFRILTYVYISIARVLNRFI